MLNRDKAGVPGTTYVFVTLDQQGRIALDAFEAAILPVRQILEFWLLTGQSDYVLRVVFRDTKEQLHTEIITQLPHVIRAQSTPALRAVERTT